MRVSLANSARSFPVDAGRSVLDGALAAGLNLPHSCKSGNCGSCRARLVGGSVDYPHGRPLGLSDAEAADGFVLLCQARARGDLVIEITEIRPAQDIGVRRMPCRIERAAPLSHDVMALFLRLPAVEDFRFLPGQYVDVMLDGGRRRSFSIATPPHASRPLELHVRHVPGGEFTGRLFDASPERRLLTIEGPLGQFTYRDSAAPMLMVGGGTGLAPLLSMLRHVVDNRLVRDVTLYWGVRSERDLYADTQLRGLAAAARAGGAAGAGAGAGLRYVPVLSEPAPDWRGRTGYVHAAVLEDHARLDAFDIYASGPPAMIDAVRSGFVARGADPQRLYFDSFDYAPDTLERQRSNASTSA